MHPALHLPIAADRQSSQLGTLQYLRHFGGTETLHISVQCGPHSLHRIACTGPDAGAGVVTSSSWPSDGELPTDGRITMASMVAMVARLRARVGDPGPILEKKCVKIDTKRDCVSGVPLKEHPQGCYL